jgi:CheY-like chemotaxis protein
MRKRRAILYDDDPAILDLLTMFFAGRGYDVIACREPVACPVYDNGERCENKRPCGDLMITDLEMPRMSGLDLLKLQTRQGCRLTVRNKAVLSGNLDPASREAISSLGCATFRKPCRFSALAPWVDECEQRMDLSQTLGVQRVERRAACCSVAVFTIGREAGTYTAEVVNRSDSGLCVRIDKPLEVAQVLRLRSRLPLPSDRLLVRWMRPDAGGCFLAGMSSC